MNRREEGFTLIEMVFALLIGTILISIALGSFRNAQARYASRGAKTMYMTLHQKARSKAIEKGETVLLFVDATGDSAFVFSASDGITDVTRFRPELNVDLRLASMNSYVMCMTPRGYADYDCGSYAQWGITATTSDTIRLQFWQNADSTSVLILPLGQLVGA